MIDITIEKRAKRRLMKQISQALGVGENSAETYDVLRKAVNETAKQVRKQLASTAQETYAVKNAGFNKAMKIKNATRSTLTAIVSSKSPALELINFKTNPAKVNSNPPEVVKAKVLQKNQLKALEKDGIKAFIVKFASGHTAIAERVGKERLPIKTLYSRGVAAMLGDEKRVYGIIKPKIRDMLQEQVYKAIDRQIAKAAREAG